MKLSCIALKNKSLVEEEFICHTFLVPNITLILNNAFISFNVVVFHWSLFIGLHSSW
jgi:hypothetical protein